MKNIIGNLNLNIKISILGIGSVLITAMSLLGLAVWQSGQYNSLAQNDVDNLINADLDHITQSIYTLVETEDLAVQQQVDYNLNVAHYIFTRAGDVTLSDEKVTWFATNQFKENTTRIQIPKMLIGSQWLGQNTDQSIETVVVDEIESLIGETVTIFQCMNENGDMLRVATTVTNSDGQRAIGTYIPAVNPDGSPNPVIEAVMNGDTYHGRAYVVDDWYLTAYQPIYDTSENLVGMLYVGVKLENIENRVRQAILQTKVGKTGYVFILRGTGEERGYYIISKDGLRDGENIWNSKDYNDNYFIQELISKALVLEPGEMESIRYSWQNIDEQKPRWKVAKIAYYEPWDWVIGISAYEDELQIYKTILNDGRTRMTTIMGLAGLIISLLIGILGLLMAWSIAHPIRKLTDMVETITQGNLNQIVDIQSKDEIGVLSQAFNQMTANQREILRTLENSERRFRSLIENSSDLICVLNKQGKILYESPSIERILGYNPQERIDKFIYEYIPEEEVYPIREIIAEMVDKENFSTQFEVRFLHHDGTYSNFEIACNNRLSDPSINGIILNSRDITKRKQIENELSRYRAHLEDEVTQRTSQLTTINQDLETFNYSVSHDLRAHIRAINAYSQFILDNENHQLSADDKKYLENILNESRRMQALIEDLIKLSHVSHSPINSEEIDLSDLFRSIIRGLELSNPERKVETKVVEGLITYADKGLITIAMENLIGNAWKFTSQRDTAQIEFGSEQYEGTVVFYIRDNGAGFDMKYADKIFTPFQRFHSEQEFPGTGIGLSTVNRIIQRHAGKIWADSQPNIGTTIYFSLSK